MNIQRSVTLGAAVLGVVATFLPWASFLGMSISGIESDGIFATIAFVAAIAFAMLGDRKEALTSSKWKFGVVAAGALAAAVALLTYFNAVSEGIAGLVGFGLWLTVLCGIALVAIPFLKVFPAAEKIDKEVASETIDNAVK